MKNLVKIVLLSGALLVAIISCNNNNESENESETMLIGKWKAVSSSQQPNDDERGWFVSYDDPLTNLIYEFRTNGTCSGNVEIMELVPVEGNWVLDNSKLTIESEEYNMVYDVAKLDASNLILHFRWKPENTVYYELIFKKE